MGQLARTPQRSEEFKCSEENDFKKPYSHAVFSNSNLNLDAACFRVEKQQCLIIGIVSRDLQQILLYIDYM